jgi:hypothetical protein
MPANTSAAAARRTTSVSRLPPMGRSGTRDGSARRAVTGVAARATIAVFVASSGERELAKSEGRAREAKDARERIEKERMRNTMSESAIANAWTTYEKACSELMVSHIISVYFSC